MNLNDLKKVIPYRFRIQSYSKNKPSAQCVAYIDARDVMDLLDQVCGVENWQCSYKEIKNNIYCEISIFINGQWVSKMDCGTESKTEAEKGEASDSFKRAAVKWGIGRFLYEIPMQFVKTDAVKDGNNYPNVIDDNGKKVWDLSEYLIKKVNLPENKSKFNLSEVEKTFNSALNFDILKKYYETALELYPNNQKEVFEAKERAKKALNDKITNEALQEIKA